MKCCPICGGAGVERSRESVVKDGKLMERVIMDCDHASHGPGAFIRFDDPTHYDRKEARLKLEVSRQLYTKEQIQVAIETSDGNVAGIARKLFISTSTMWGYLDRYPVLRMLVEERRIVGKVERMTCKIEEDKTLRKRLERHSSAVTPLMDRLVETLDRAQKDKRRERMRSKIGRFNHE